MPEPTPSSGKRADLILYGRDTAGNLGPEDKDKSNELLLNREKLKEDKYKPVDKEFIVKKVQSTLRDGLENNGNYTIILDGPTSSGKSTLVSGIIEACAAVKDDECKDPTHATAMTIKTSLVVPIPSNSNRQFKTYVIGKKENGTNKLVAKEENPALSEEGCFVTKVAVYLERAEKAMKDEGIIVARGSKANPNSSRAITIHEIVICKNDGVEETCVTLNLVDPPGHESRDDNETSDIRESAAVRELVKMHCNGVLAGVTYEDDRTQQSQSDTTFITKRLQDFYREANLYICCVNLPFIHRRSENNLIAGLDHAEKILDLLQEQTPRPDVRSRLFELIGETHGKVQSQKLKLATARRRVANYESWATNMEQLQTTLSPLLQTPSPTKIVRQPSPPNTYLKHGGDRANYWDFDSQRDSVETASTSTATTLFPLRFDDKCQNQLSTLIGMDRFKTSIDQTMWVIARLALMSDADGRNHFLEDLRDAEATIEGVDHLQRFLKICKATNDALSDSEPSFTATLMSSVKLFLQGEHRFDNAAIWFAATAAFLGDEETFEALKDQCGEDGLMDTDGLTDIFHYLDNVFQTQLDSAVNRLTFGTATNFETDSTGDSSEESWRPLDQSESSQHAEFHFTDVERSPPGVIASSATASDENISEPSAFAASSAIAAASDENSKRSANDQFVEALQRTNKFLDKENSEPHHEEFKEVLLLVEKADLVQVCALLDSFIVTTGGQQKRGKSRKQDNYVRALCHLLNRASCHCKGLPLMNINDTGVSAGSNATNVYQVTRRIVGDVKKDFDSDWANDMEFNKKKDQMAYEVLCFVIGHVSRHLLRISEAKVVEQMKVSKTDQDRLRVSLGKLSTELQQLSGETCVENSGSIDPLNESILKDCEPITVGSGEKQIYANVATSRVITLIPLSPKGFKEYGIMRMLGILKTVAPFKTATLKVTRHGRMERRDQGGEFLFVESELGIPFEIYRRDNKDDQEKMRKLVETLVGSILVLQAALGIHRDLSGSNLVVLEEEKGELVVAPIDWETFRSWNHAAIPCIDGMTTPSIMTPEEIFGASTVPVIHQDVYAVGMLIVAILGGFPSDTYSFVREGVEDSENLEYLSDKLAKKWRDPAERKRWFHIRRACTSRQGDDESPSQFAKSLAGYAYFNLVLLNGATTGTNGLLSYISKKWGFQETDLIKDTDEFDDHCAKFSLENGSEMQVVRDECDKLGEDFFKNLCSCLCVNSALRPMLQVLNDSITLGKRKV